MTAHWTASMRMSGSPPAAFQGGAELKVPPELCQKLRIAIGVALTELAHLAVPAGVLALRDRRLPVARRREALVPANGSGLRPLRRFEVWFGCVLGTMATRSIRMRCCQVSVAVLLDLCLDHGGCAFWHQIRLREQVSEGLTFRLLRADQRKH
jgi:hypothetical protein